jgi:mRNA interferase RelE/StbE
MWAVHLPSRVEKELSELPKDRRNAVEDTLQQLQDNPRPQGCKKLKGHLQCWRVRVGAYRILYDIHDSKHRVVILKIGPRKDVYRSL